MGLTFVVRFLATSKPFPNHIDIRLTLLRFAVPGLSLLSTNPIKARIPSELAVTHTVGNLSYRDSTMPPKNNNNNNTSWWPGNRNQPPEVPGLNELVELLTLMGSAPAGTRPQLNPDLIEVIRGSPLLPVIKALQPIYKKLVSMAETEQAGPATPKQEAQPPPPPTPKATTTPPPADVAPQQQSHAAPSLDVSGIEAGMTSLSSKLDFVSQAVSVSRSFPAFGQTVH